MKKLILTSLVLMMAVMAQAQTKIAPKLEKGFKAVYTEENNVEVSGMALKSISEVEYAVSNVTAKGAVINVTNTSVKVEADDSNPMASLLTATMEMLEGVTVKFNTNADGKVLGIANIDEVKAQATKTIKAMVEKVFKDNPSMSQMVSREAMEAQLVQSVSEDALVQSLTNSSVLALNGKTISNGATDSHVNSEGLKMKSMYFVMGKKIIVNSSLDMTKDELKAFIIKQVETQAPEQAKMVKENIDMVMGQMSFESSTKTTYDLQDNGWVKSIKSESSQTAMGQSQKSTTVTTLKQ